MHILLTFLAVFLITFGTMAFIIKICKSFQGEKQVFIIELFFISIGITILLVI